MPAGRTSRQGTAKATTDSLRPERAGSVPVGVSSTGECMLLHFDAGTEVWVWDSEGLILTASIGHSITIADDIVHGSDSCSNFWVKGTSQTIPLAITADPYYDIGVVNYNDGSNHTLTPDVNGAYSFTMPDKPVSVSATSLLIRGLTSSISASSKCQLINSRGLAS